VLFLPLEFQIPLLFVFLSRLLGASVSSFLLFDPGSDHQFVDNALFTASEKQLLLVVFIFDVFPLGLALGATVVQLGRLIDLTRALYYSS